MKKTIGILVLMLVGLLFLCGIVNAAVEITKVEVDGTEVTDDDDISLDVERGSDVFIYDIEFFYYRIKRQPLVVVQKGCYTV